MNWISKLIGRRRRTVLDWDTIEADYMKANMEMAIKRGSGFLAYETVEWFKKRIK